MDYGRARHDGGEEGTEPAVAASRENAFSSPRAAQHQTLQEGFFLSSISILFSGPLYEIWLTLRVLLLVLVQPAQVIKS